MLCAPLLSLAGCSMLRMDEGRLMAIGSATYAGKYHVDQGRWPATGAELAAFMCRDRPGFTRVGDPSGPCADPRFHTELRPLGDDLEMTLLDAGQRTVCRLRLFAPHKSIVAASMVVRTSVFSCPGGGASWQ